MIHVIALVTAKPGRREELLQAFRANVPAVHAEEGCIEYGPAIDAAAGPFDKFGEDVMVVVEKWSSLETLKAHGSGPVMKAYGEKTRDLVAKRAVYVLDPAG